MKIFFTLDQDEGIDPNDPVGDILITDDQNQNTLVVKSTYLDSWFDVLIDGLTRLQNHDKITLEIVEEPELITFEKLSEGFKITYGKQALFFNTLDNFYQALLSATQEFLAQLQPDQETLSRLPILQKITHFLALNPLNSYY